MTTRKRPSLRDNMTEGGDETARQLEQAAQIEQARRSEAAEPPAATSAFEESPSPVAALAHAYMHGSGSAPPAGSSGRGLSAVAAVLGLSAVGMAAAAGVLGFKDFKEGRAVVAAAPAPAAAPARTPPASSAAPAAPVQVAAPAVPAPSATPVPAPAAAPPAKPAAQEGATASAAASNLSDRVAALEKELAQVSGGSQVIGILAARQLRGALADSAPFQSELALARLSGVATGDLGKALDRVAPRAAEGIPSRIELNARFAALVPVALNAELGAAGGSSVGAVGETMWGWVTGVASVLRLTSAQPAEEEGKSAVLLARAGIMLEAGDLSGAIERVAGLEGPAAQAATSWVNDARARAAADQAVTLLANRVTEMLAAGKR